MLTDAADSLNAHPTSMKSEPSRTSSACKPAARVRRCHCRIAARSELGKSYEALLQLAPAILNCQRNGNITGFLLNRTHPDVSVTMNRYRLDISLDDIFGNRAETGYCL